MYKRVIFTQIQHRSIRNKKSRKHGNTKRKSTQLESFINDLIYKGNPSTSVLEKSLGKEETIRLFKEIIFKSSREKDESCM